MKTIYNMTWNRKFHLKFFSMRYVEKFPFYTRQGTFLVFATHCTVEEFLQTSAFRHSMVLDFQTSLGMLQKLLTITLSDHNLTLIAKLYIPSTLNIDLILWHTQLIVCAENGFFISLFKLISCPIHWIVCVLAYLNFIFEFLSSFSAAQNGRLCPDT